MSIKTPEAPTNGHERKLDGVRTYRGRRLEDIIPQIRADLGPDAVILRQREGLTGGVSGFFAQRCVELDARAGTPQIDLYDDDDDDETGPEGFDAPVAPAIENRAVAAPGLATSPAPDLARQSAPEPVPGLASPPARDVERDPAPDLAPGFAPHPSPGPPEPLFAPPSFANHLAQARTSVAADQAVVRDVARPADRAVARDVAPAAGRPVAQDVAPAAGNATDGAPEPTSAPDDWLARDTPAQVRLDALTQVAASAQAAAGAKADRRSAPHGRRAVAARRAPVAAPQPEVAVPRPTTPPRMLDDNVAASGLRELTERGISDAWAQELIAFGVAHCKPFATDVRGAVRTSLAASLPTPAPLPSTGAAIAIVGAGGAGKTRSAAALACRYGRDSTLPVTVVALGSRDAGAEIMELLHDEDSVHVTAASDAGGAVTAVSADRSSGLVVIDTAAARPGEPAAVAALARELAALALDAVYIVVPATLSARAGANLIEGFAPLAPTGIVIGHADETDHLGVAIELSRDSGIPIAYVHEGFELDRALALADPHMLANRLLS